MNSFAVLLADFGVVKSMSNRFHGKQAQLHTGDLMMGLGLLVIVGLAAWGLSRLTRRSDDRPRHNNARSLFRELCRAHDIDRAGRALLQKVARSQNRLPASLFLDPDCWQPEKLAGEWSSAEHECRALYERLFAIVDKAEAAETSPVAETAPADEAAASNTTHSA